MLTVKRLRYLVLIAVALFVAVQALQGPQGVPAWREKREKIRVAENEVNELRRTIRRLQQESAGMNRPEQQELIIREQLKLVKPGDKVYVLGK